MLSMLRSFTSTDFDYSPFYRLFEITAILSCFVLASAILYRAYTGLAELGAATAIWLIPTTAIIGYVGSDFASGFVHWMGDTYGSKDMPVLGEAFVKPFREHHVDPKGIVEHDYVEVNGNNSIVLALWMIPVVVFITDPTSAFQFFILVTSVTFTMGVFMTNQFHKWSHMEDPPAYIRKLQDWGLILGRDHHGVHHTAPYDTYYCITCGWLNPILSRIQFFETIEGINRRLFGLKTSREKGEAT